MLHHIDIHVRNIDAAQTLLDALAEHIGYRRISGSDELEEPGFVGYETAAGGRPRFGLIPDPAALPGSTRVAFAVETRAQVAAAAIIAREHGARAIEGPGLHPEYGDYYAVFFEDAGGNKFEIAADAQACRQFSPRNE
ncbi:MAG: VOC family protein [Candidatus Cybelea sp.]|jgi:catechol 2,3-dioxygenase-like lactoylglutathione lyase family enzyme